MPREGNWLHPKKILNDIIIVALKFLPLNFIRTTDRLRLRIPGEEDIPHVFEASHDPSLSAVMLGEPPASPEELRGSLERSVKNWKDAVSYQFTIEIGGEFAGRITLRDTIEDHVLDVGYWTHPRFRRRGIMKEALYSMVGLAFGRLNANAIVASYSTWNEASRRVMETVGFSAVETILGGDEVKMRLNRADWERIPS